MIVRDYYCPQCGHIHRDVFVDRGVLDFSSICSACHALVEMHPVCNGGLNSRYRENDWPSDPFFYKGQTDHTVEVVEHDDNGNEVPTQLLTGGSVHDSPRFADPDRKAERNDKHEFEYKREHGRLTQFYQT